MYSIRNVEDGQTIALTGGKEPNDGSLEFCIGLTLDESLTFSIRHESTRPSSGASGDMGSSMHGGDRNIVVPLVMLTVWKNSGITVCPANRDLPCCLNGEEVEKEAHIIPGSHIEVADKTLELVEGKAPVRPRPHRRHLPPTPGVPILPSPPPKPQRSNNKGGVRVPPAPPRQRNPKDLLKEELREWCLVQLPTTEQELLQQAKDPDQLASLASSYLSRHINIHTDMAMTADMTDRINKMLHEVACHRKEIIKTFLADVIADVMSSQGEETPRPSPHSPTQGTQHSTVTSLLVEILRQFLDPQYLVLLCLQLLRALSHVPGNVVTMVTGQTISAVLGSMAVFRDEEDIQNFSLDILAKMATFVPNVLAKPPMRESSIELVCLAMLLHDTSFAVIAAAIRVFANLATSLHSMAFNAMIGPPTPDLRGYVEGVLEVLDYLYQKTSGQVRTALADCGQDLNIKMDGRRFLFEFSKMDQLRRQHQLWECQPDSTTQDRHHNGEVWRGNTATAAATQEMREEDTQRQGSEEYSSSPTEVRQEDEEYYEREEEEEEEFDEDTRERDASGILKKCRSFENLRTPDRKVFFKEAHLNSGSPSSSPSPSSSSDEDEDKRPVDDRTRGSENRSASPDVQVLSRSRICPSTLSPIPSQNGDDETPHRRSPIVFASSTTPPTTMNSKEVATTPPTPVRRQIQAPLVHINSQSDSEADSVLNSPIVSSKFIGGKRKGDEIIHKDSSAAVADNPDDRYADITNLDTRMRNVGVMDPSAEPYSDSSSSSLVSDYSTSISSSSPIIPPRQPLLPSRCAAGSVDLTGFNYSAADVKYMKRLMCVQVTCHICSSSIEGSNPVTLKLIDLPLGELLQAPSIPRAVRQFAASQLDPNASLMDIDPSTVISIIDAVRYKMLAYDLVRKSVQHLIQKLSSGTHQKIVLATGELLQSVAADSSLSPIVEDAEFTSQVETELVKLEARGFKPAMTSFLMDSLKPLALRS